MEAKMRPWKRGKIKLGEGKGGGGVVLERKRK